MYALLLASPAMAMRIDDLYAARIPIADQGAASRKAGIRSALATALVKITGDQNAARQPALRPILNNSGRYMLQYRYHQNETPSAEAAAENMQLSVLFDESVLNQALRDNGIAVWGKERPSVLIWLVVQNETGRRIIGLEDETSYLDIIDRHARSRGIPLLFPLLDIEDTSGIKTGDSWSGFTEAVINASNRYRADVVLLGSIEQTRPSLWETRWTSIIQGQTIDWSAQAERAETALVEGIDALADKLARQYGNTQLHAGQETLALVVHNIDTLDQYAKVLRYLESLNSIKDIRVKQLQGGKITFELTNLGGISAIRQAAALGDTLELVPDSKEPEFQLKKR